MEASPLPVSAAVPSVSYIDALGDALRTERRLLDELARVLVIQREGISSDNLETLDESVFAAHRIFRTLREARQRRRTLLELMGVSPDLRLDDLDDEIEVARSPELQLARDQLLVAAGQLARELTMNRRLIDGAMAVGTQLIQVFTGSVQRPTLYSDDGAEPPDGGNMGALLNTRV
jgi:flagellar biosynthesis/type III secretory pathway chaperone